MFVFGCLLGGRRRRRSREAQTGFTAQYNTGTTQRARACLKKIQNAPRPSEHVVVVVRYESSRGDKIDRTKSNQTANNFGEKEKRKKKAGQESRQKTTDKKLASKEKDIVARTGHRRDKNKNKSTRNRNTNKSIKRRNKQKATTKYAPQQATQERPPYKRRNTTQAGRQGQGQRMQHTAKEKHRKKRRQQSNE